MTKKTIIVVLIAIILILGGFLVVKNIAHAPEDGVSPETNKESTILISESGNLRVTSPKMNSVLDGPTFSVTGEARLWYFEGSFPVYLYDNEGKMVSAGPVTAKGDWMTAEFVPFQGTFDISPNAKAGSGYILFQEDNPADEAERGRPLDSYKIPVVIPELKTTTVKVYFGTQEALTANCSAVVPVERTVIQTAAIGKSAIEALIKGTTQLERKNGLVSEIPSYVTLNSLVITNGVAKIDLSGIEGGGSCRVGMIRAQIESTLKQFPTVQSVEVSINGKSDILEP